MLLLNFAFLLVLFLLPDGPQKGPKRSFKDAAN